MNIFELRKVASEDANNGRKGWTKARCLDKRCNTITLWNSKVNGKKCNEGACAKCGGAVTRTTWSTTHDYIVEGA